MSWFGNEEQDYEQILGFIVVDFDDYVIQNFHKLHVENGEIKVIPDSTPIQYL